MKRISIFIFIMISISCKKDHNNPPPPDKPVPGKATLIYPEHDATCIATAYVTNLTGSITFSWDTTANTSSYELTVRNLLTRAVTIKILTTNQSTDTLSLKTPYSWTVKSKSTQSDIVTQSDTSKFYIAGSPDDDFSPYPARLTSPTFNQHISGTTTNFTWIGLDNDELSEANTNIKYDFYFGLGITPPLYKSNVTDMFLNNVPVMPGTYYWKVVTRDKEGNTSISDVYPFVVD